MKIFSPHPNKIKPGLTEAQKYIRNHYDRTFTVEAFYFKDLKNRREYYRTTERSGRQYGIDRRFLRSFINDRLWDSQMVMFHAPDFKIEGALGWIVRIKGMPVAQTFADIGQPSVRSSELKTKIGETIVHEVLHHLYRKYGLRDRTHYWMDRDDYASAFAEIRKAKPGRLERWLNAFRNTLDPSLEDIDAPWVLHHSGSENDTIEGVRSDHKKKYGRTFYNVIVDYDGTLHYEHNEYNKRGNGYSKGIMVMGDWRVAEREAQIEEAAEFLRDKVYISHKKAHRLSLAPRSTVCPGKLVEYIEEYYNNH